MWVAALNDVMCRRTVAFVYGWFCDGILCTVYS